MKWWVNEWERWSAQPQSKLGVAAGEPRSFSSFISYPFTFFSLAPQLTDFHPSIYLLLSAYHPLHPPKHQLPHLYTPYNSLPSESIDPVSFDFLIAFYYPSTSEICYSRWPARWNPLVLVAVAAYIIAPPFCLAPPQHTQSIMMTGLC